ncbi:hypothetical protein [Embleya sp. NPDC005971]|uniref:hypothetical protein n=1 Tax=Embleya sp. NPDC005971 TaxID=3156724 RepID=UPI0033C74C71
MRLAVARLRRRLGRRGAFLTIAGAGKVCLGVGFLVAPPTSTRGLEVLTNAAPLHCWAWVWVLAGSVTFACGWLRVGNDGAGFLAALVPPSLWAAAYLWSAVTGEYARGAWLSAWYLTSHIGVICWAATVPEHSVPPVRRARASDS